MSDLPASLRSNSNRHWPASGSACANTGAAIVNNQTMSTALIMARHRFDIFPSFSCRDKHLAYDAMGISASEWHWAMSK
jgi:hypothetical protein